MCNLNVPCAMDAVDSGIGSKLIFISKIFNPDKNRLFYRISFPGLHAPSRYR